MQRGYVYDYYLAFDHPVPSYTTHHDHAPLTPSVTPAHPSTEYGIDYLVDFGLLHTNATPSASNNNITVDIADHTSSINMTYDEELLLRVAAQANLQSYPDLGLPVARLRHPLGSSVDICLHGAAITSWKRPDGSEILQLDPSNKYNGIDPISGGLTTAWPQLGAGSLPLNNGVLQYLHWSVLETSCWDIEEDPRPSITLYADSEDVRMSGVREEFGWPFEAMLTVTLGVLEADEEQKESNISDETDSDQSGSSSDEDADEEGGAGKADADAVDAADADVDVDADDGMASNANAPVFELTYQLSILNKHETDPLTFSTGAIANFKVDKDHPNTVKVNGLAGKYALDYSKDPMRPALEIENEHFIKPLMDQAAPSSSRLFVDCPPEGEVLVCPGSQHHFDVRNVKGFTDVLLETREKNGHSVAVGAARKAKPVRLQPGDVWEGEATFKSFDRYWAISAYEMEHDRTNIPVPAREEALLRIRKSEENNNE